MNFQGQFKDPSHTFCTFWWPADMAAASEGPWREVIAAEWARRRAADETCVALFPLATNPFGEEEILAMTNVLLTGKLTLGDHVAQAEKDFAEMVGAPYAVMVNSGSSANLLAVSAIMNKFRSRHCEVGDEVLVPAVSWSTSVFPLLQLNLKPVFVDTDPVTFNITMETLEAAMTPRVKAVMAVHVLGNSICMDDLAAFTKKHDLMLIEDTCESLGSYFSAKDGQKMLGVLGDFGCYSFYFSHHVTSGEGGAVVCKTEEDYNFLRCLRAHGWTRHLTNREEVEKSHPDIDPRFLFVNLGYNLRPMEVQGAMLTVQLRKLHEYNRIRRDNLQRISSALHADPRFAKLMSLMQPGKGVDPAWFGISVLLHRSFSHQRDAYLKYLQTCGIENRPVISGNFLRQPSIKMYCKGINPEDFPGSEAIHARGFFIGVHQIPIEDSRIAQLVSFMLAFPFQAWRTVLVTGSNGMLGSNLKSVVLDMEPKGELATEHATWHFVTRHDADLGNLDNVETLFKKFAPTHVVHCAGKLASIKEMSSNPVDYWLDNSNMNNNLLRTAFKFQSWLGPIKVVSVLSTVMFPQDASLPMGTSCINAGQMHPASEAYGLSKRALSQLTKWYNKQHHTNFVSVLPGNFYGPHGNFDPETAPLVNALIAKAEAAKQTGQPLKVMGTGMAERQVMLAEDLARVLLWALDNYNGDEPLIVAGQEVSIKHIAEVVEEAAGLTTGLAFDATGPDGPQKRTADTAEFEKQMPDFSFTPLKDGIRATLAWYRNQRARLQ